MNKDIRAVFIFEIMGRPKEHIVVALEQFIENLSKIKGLTIAKKKIHEPKEVEGAEGFFTTFAEVEVVVPDISLIFVVTFNMFPSHVEIIEPEELVLSNFEVGSIVSDLALKLHKYDELAKGLVMERENLIKKLKELDPECVSKLGVQSLREAPSVKKESKEKTTKKTKKK